MQKKVKLIIFQKSGLIRLKTTIKGNKSTFGGYIFPVHDHEYTCKHMHLYRKCIVHLTNFRPLSFYACTKGAHILFILTFFYYFNWV